jgi:radical SAM protein
MSTPTPTPAPCTAADLSHSPFLVFYEITRACDLACAHCRACAQSRRHPLELTTGESLDLVDNLLRFDKPPLLVLTGGDPLKRPDVFDVVSYAVNRGLQVAMTPSATPLVTRQALARLRDAGLGRLAVSLDAADAATHDAFRRVPGSYQRTLEILADARDLGLSLQINTTITSGNVHQVDAMADLVARQGVALWSVFFLVPVGRGQDQQRISPEQYEAVFERLWHHASTRPMGIKTTEAHHYRRFVLQRMGNPQRHAPSHAGDRLHRAPLGINDGKGVLFVSHTGQIFPSGFMPIECGRFPRDCVVDVYRHSDLFRALRRPDEFHGKCGRCEFRHICGGSRARAYALTGDPLASEPDCIYQPRAMRDANPEQETAAPA